MSFESLRSLIPLPAVHAKPDAARVNPDGQGRQNQREQQSEHAGHQDSEGSPHPVPNAQGQMTGKLIDTVA